MLKRRAFPRPSSEETTLVIQSALTSILSVPGWRAAVVAEHKLVYAVYFLNYIRISSVAFREASRTKLELPQKK